MLLSAILLVPLLLTSCDPLDDRNPVEGHSIPGTEGVRCGSGIHLSPAGNWAAFWFKADQDHESHKPLPAAVDPLALLDLRSWAVRVPRNQSPPDPDSADTPGLTTLCWRNDPEPALLAGARLDYANAPRLPDGRLDYASLTRHWYGVDLARPDELYQITNKPVPAFDMGKFRMRRAAGGDSHTNKAQATGKSDEPDLSCQPSRPSRQWQPEGVDPLSHRPNIMRGVRVEKPAPDSVVLILENGRQLAYHESNAWIRSVRVSVDNYAWSPHGDWIVYTISTIWETLASRPHTYVVPRSGDHKPVPLAGEVWSYRWVGNDLLLGCVVPNEFSSTSEPATVLQYWRVSDLRR